MQNAKTTVLIPHYNNLSGLKVSLKSIWHPWSINILVVDDGSGFELDEEDLRFHIKPTCNLSVVKLLQNQGIEYALNVGLEYILEKPTLYVARLDCGDCCARDRFVEQEKFLDNNKDFGIVGAAVRFLQDGKVVFRINYPNSDSRIRRYAYYNSPFCHPAVLFRLDLIKQCGFYSIDFKRAEDYELFCRFLNVSKGANLDSSFVDVELNVNGISLRHRKKQMISRLKIQWKNRRILSLHFWIGLVKTLFTMLFPYAMAHFIKKIFFR